MDVQDFPKVWGVGSNPIRESNGRVMELVYMLVLETSASRIVGSTPTLTTKRD
jgi:hypothetical protein